MPNYDFSCDCGYTKVEFLTMLKRDTPQKCQKCGKKMVRLIGMGGGFILKGEGFYQNDYPKDKGV